MGRAAHFETWADMLKVMWYHADPVTIVGWTGEVKVSGHVVP